MSNRVFISSSIDEEKLPNFKVENQLMYGRAHYSWKIVANLYRLGFEAAGIDVIPVARPEIYQDPIAHKVFGVRESDIHMAVKPIEHLRSFYGIKNIFISGWEFPEFSETAYDDNPFNNHIAVLKHADEIWCWSDFTRNNLHAYGLTQAITMPPPALKVILSEPEDIGSISTLSLNTTRQPIPEDIISLDKVLNQYKDSIKFVTVLNPFDRRKQINLLLESFLNASKHNPNIVLFIKLVIDNLGTTLRNIQEILSAHYQFHGIDERIVFIGETLSDKKMYALMQSCDHYLCTSSTEGLNLPLIEAMSLGVVPISTNATAMADYIDNTNAIILAHEQKSTNGPYHGFAERLHTTHFPPTLKSVTDSILYAASLSNAERHILSLNAQITVESKYSIRAFVERLNSHKGGQND